MATLYLIRHAEPELSGVMLGQLDPALSAAGEAQAAALSELHVEAAWSSPLRRARETAAYVNARRFTALPALREIDQGEWTGKTWAEIEATWPALAEHKLSDWLGFSAPGGETWPVFVERVQSAWKVIREGPSPVAVIGHQGTNAALLHLLRGRDPLAFAQRHGEAIRLDYD